MNPLLISQPPKMEASKPILKVDFVDFGFFNKTDNFFTKALSKHYTVSISDKPDIVFFSNTGNSHLHRLYPCKRFFWTGESTTPDYRQCDFSMTPLSISDTRHCRLPYYVVGAEASPEDLIKTSQEIDIILSEHRQGCAVVISNKGKMSQYRSIFLNKLRCHISVASGGRSFNNIGGPLPPGGPEKIKFIKKYRFNMCFENKSRAGYVTEKIVEAMMARCIPIYWGDPDIVKEFNPKSFINVHEFSSEEACIKRITEIETNDQQYEAMLREPYFDQNVPNLWYNLSLYSDFLKECVENPAPPIGSIKRWHHFGRWKLAKRMHR
jgi:alpha(1,3/1,4) fucosyltransferase